MTMTFLLWLCSLQDVDALIRDLGADAVETREAAHAELLKIGKPALDALRKAAASTDPEVSARARRIVRKIKVRENLWEFDPEAAATKKAEAVLKGAVKLKKIEAFSSEWGIKHLPEYRFFLARTTMGDPAVGTPTSFVIVDIDGEATMTSGYYVEEGPRKQAMAELFKGAGVTATDAAERRAAAREWVRLLTLEDTLAADKWWGGLKESAVAGDGTRVSVTVIHGKSFSWTDEFTLDFDATGALTSAGHVAQEH